MAGGNREPNDGADEIMILMFFPMESLAGSGQAAECVGHGLSGDGLLRFAFSDLGLREIARIFVSLIKTHRFVEFI